MKYTLGLHGVEGPRYRRNGMLIRATLLILVLLLATGCGQFFTRFTGNAGDSEPVSQAPEADQTDGQVESRGDTGGLSSSEEMDGAQTEDEGVDASGGPPTEANGAESVEDGSESDSEERRGGFWGFGGSDEEEVDDRLPLERTTNVLVLGSDRRPNMPNWRTDVIMVIAMDFETGEAGVISLPRDLYIEDIPGHPPNRINVVDYVGERDNPDGGGPELLSTILEDRLAIPIHHYLRFDFQGFKDVVDALNGVEISIDCGIYDYMPEEDIALSLQPGVHRLNGRQALSYVRTRRQGGDIDRARRQQRMLWAVRDQILRENLISRVPALYTALHDTVQTDVGLVTAIRFVRFALSLDDERLHGFVVAPPDLVQESWRGGMFVFVADWDTAARRAQELFDRPPMVETNTVGEGGDQPTCP